MSRPDSPSRWRDPLLNTEYLVRQETSGIFFVDTKEEIDREGQDSKVGKQFSASDSKIVRGTFAN
jgi:hypothetical protein